MGADPVELQAAWERAAGPEPEARWVLELVVARHREPHRRYHGVQHVVWVIRHAHALIEAEPVDDAGAVIAAALFHDAVYDPRATDNEAASGRLAARHLSELGWSPERTTRVAAMIEATAGHADPADHDTAVLLDADLAVLGADPAGYQAYATGVRSEYAHVPPATWRTGRAAVLERFLERPAIYATASGREWWEALARANLSAELATLR